jgi:hypothetical protein
VYADRGYLEFPDFIDPSGGFHAGGKYNFGPEGVSAGTKGEITVYRVFGGDARAQGFSWTTKNPTSIKDFRDAAGLPSGGASGATNTAEFMIKGRVNSSNIIKYRFRIAIRWE